MFVLVRVSNDYDHIDGVEFVDKFVTKEQAEAEIALRDTQWRELHIARAKYIDEYIHTSVKTPVLATYRQWYDFLRDYFVDENVLQGEMVCNHEDGWGQKFDLEKEKLIRNKFSKALSIKWQRDWSNGWTKSLKDYNPPPVNIGSPYNLFIVEIPD